MPHLSASVDDLIRSDISSVLLLLSVPWQFMEGSDDQGRGRRHYGNLGLSVLNGQFHGDPPALSITGSFGNITIDSFWRQTQGAGLEGQGRRGTEFPTGSLQVYGSDLLSSGWNFGVMVRAAAVGRTRPRRPEDATPKPSLSQKPKAGVFLKKRF